MNNPSIDLFCRVVDNFGDIGVCWRLARQLATEHGLQIRLIVDDLKVFRKIEPRLDERLSSQSLDGVLILHWSDGLGEVYGDPATVVIEGFACTLPDGVIERMKRTKPVWIDFEYLTAEDWPEDCHARPSNHPAGLKKTLFFPGFTSRTGGLIRERDLLRRRDAFRADRAAQNLWRAGAGLPPCEDGILDISLFCYPDPPFHDFTGVRVFLPEGVVPDLAGPNIVRFPFLTSGDYDRLLWTCDLNFVRGEDSWVRAIWAGKPFIWQVYKQDDGAHLTKLKAFLDRYMGGLPSGTAESLAKFHAMWNEGDREGKTASLLWDSFLPLLPHLKDHALSWSGDLAGSEDCATSLIRFIRTQLQ